MATLKSSLDASALKTGATSTGQWNVPSGVVFPYGGGTAPAGFLLCDGSAVSRTTYAALFAAVGTVWGYGDNSSTFNLPDLRGRFMRGRANGSANDPDRAARTASATDGATGDNVGSVQTNATNKNGLSASADAPAVSGSTSKSLNSGSAASNGNHTHLLNQTYSGTATAWTLTSSGTSTPTATQNNAPMQSAGAHTHTVTGSVDIDHTHTAPTVTIGTGDAETRPLNANVNYIIKV
jgi:microcystin-dependent protein